MDEQRVLAVDVGGSHVKVLASGETERRRAPSGPTLTAAEMVAAALGAAAGWHWDVVSVGVPAPVHGSRVVSEPVNLGRGWVGFDFEQAFGVPTKVVNDAAMQALGSYEGGTMLFLGLGTGLGSTLIVDGRIEPMELGHLPFKKRTFEDYLGERGRRRFGAKRWQKLVAEAVEHLSSALEPDTIVLGGGNAAKLGALPANALLGSNENAFTGGFRLWHPAPRPAAGEAVGEAAEVPVGAPAEVPVGEAAEAPVGQATEVPAER
jgi:polyphosphate glucokinase